MPLWLRRPKGVYSRDTPDWFGHQRARLTVQISRAPFQVSPAIALVNSFTPACYIHVIGIQLYMVQGGQFWTHYTGGPPPVNPGMVPSMASNAEPLYSDDAQPPGMGAWGDATSPDFNDGFTILWPADGRPFYPHCDIAVIRSNSAWEIYTNEDFAYLAICFDYYWTYD